MDRKHLRVGLIWVTFGVEFLLLVTALLGAVVMGVVGADGRPFFWLLLSHMPFFAIGMAASLISRPWAQAIAILVGVLLVGVDSALIVRQTLVSGLAWLTLLIEIPGLCVLSAVWLMRRSRIVPPAAPPPITGIGGSHGIIEP